MAWPQLRGYGVHAFPVLLLLLLLLLLLPLRVTPGRERHAPEQGSRGGLQSPAEFDPYWEVSSSRSQAMSPAGEDCGRSWGMEGADGGRHVEGAWERAGKRVAPCPALGWLPGHACKGVE